MDSIPPRDALQIPYREALQRILSDPQYWLEAGRIGELAACVAAARCDSSVRPASPERIRSRLRSVARIASALSSGSIRAVETPHALRERSVWDLLDSGERTPAAASPIARDLPSLLAIPKLRGVSDDARRVELDAELDALWESIADATRLPEPWAVEGIGPVRPPAALDADASFDIAPSDRLVHSLATLTPDRGDVTPTAAPTGRPAELPSSRPATRAPRRGRSPVAPGWMWSRIRADLRDHQRRVRGSSRRRRIAQFSLLAAGLLISAVLWSTTDWRPGSGREGRRDYQIVVVPMGDPIDAGWSTQGILRRVRDGR